jgi:penicillin-binding protein 1C
VIEAFVRAGLVLAAIVGAGVAWLHGGADWAPPFERVVAGWRPSEAYLLDRHGEVIHERRVDFGIRRRPWVRLDDVSPALVRALLTAEDRRFHGHGGVDWLAVGAAALDALAGNGVRGASTLTMQLTSLLDEGRGQPAGRRGLGEKLHQMRAALALERRWSKAQILEGYLNLVGFRGELQGIGAAARTLFGKSPEGLTEAESLILAAILPSPNAAPARLAARACVIAEAGGFGSPCAEVSLLAREVLARPVRPAPDVALAPQLAPRLLHLPGERVATTLDGRTQRRVADVLRRQMLDLADSNARDAAAVVLHNATGDVLAYVGSAGPGSRARLVDGVSARRQAGSTLKPFLYGLALERGYVTAASLLDDSPVQLETGVGLYVPQNYDRDFKGTVSVRTALASSLNVPAVRMLTLTGLEPFRDRLVDFGYATLDQPGEHYGHSLALGSADVTLLDQANAYRALATGGSWSPVRLRPDDPAGPGRRVLSEAVAYIVSDILADRGARAPTFGLESPLSTRHWTAVKTGTSKSMRDNWCIGYSRDYTVAVWVGNFEGDAMRDVSGISGAAPAWREIMSVLQRGDAVDPPSPPPGAVAGRVAFDPPIEPPREEWFVAGTEPGSVQAAQVAASARIRTPIDGAVLAVDPDIPPASQWLVLEADGAPADARWVLNGERLGGALEPLRWAPVPGRHRLTLESGGVALDAVAFRVRPGVPGRVSAAD